MVMSAENLARGIVEKLQGAGHVAYFAGGCVRDRLMGRVPKDFDVATSARPEEVVRLFPRSQQVGASFGVVLVREKQGGETAQVEVATFRADGEYSDGRHPDSVRFTNAEEDARRRDFTCNGLFFDPVTGALHDFVGGRPDIQGKVLRAIGEAEARFREDHLRMLRAARFAAKLDFRIDDATFAAIQAHAPHIRTISKERIHDELANILAHSTRARAAAILHSSRLLEHLWPVELFPDPTLPRHWHGLEFLPPDMDFVLALIALYRDCASSPNDHPGMVTPPFRYSGAAVAQFLRQALLLTNTETEDFAWLLDNSLFLAGWQSLSKAALKRLIADHRWPRLEVLFEAHHLRADLAPAFRARIAQLQAEGAAPEPLVNGATLIRLGAAPGPAFKKWLEVLYNRQLEGELRTQEEAVAAARALIRAG